MQKISTQQNSRLLDGLQSLKTSVNIQKHSNYCILYVHTNNKILS